jgi:hypothetical protein
MVDNTPFLPGLSPVSGEAVVARFDGGRLSSEGGLLALREVARRLGLAGRLGCSCIDRARRSPILTHLRASYSPGKYLSSASWQIVRVLRCAVPAEWRIATKIIVGQSGQRLTKPRKRKLEKGSSYRIGTGAGRTFGWTDWQHSVRRMTASNSF